MKKAKAKAKYVDKVKWALVTGASSGIGKATAMALAKQGYSLILIARRTKVLADISKNIKLIDKELDAVAVGLDLSCQDDLSAWINDNQRVLEKVEVLINCAGFAKGVDKIQDANFQDYGDMLDVNVKGLLQITLPVVKLMAQKKSGYVFNLGSVAGRWVYPGGVGYCASKFAVRAISDAMRQDLLGTGVRVTNIEPGMVETEFSIVRLGDKKKADAVYAGMQPLTAEDIANQILWCLSQPKHINIQELVIYPTDQAHVGMVHRNS